MAHAPLKRCPIVVLALSLASAVAYAGGPGPHVEMVPLVPNTPQAATLFGSSVDIEGDTVVVGAPGYSAPSPYAGAVYVFVRNGANWVEQAKIEAPDGAAGDWFGSAVALDGDRVAILARGDNTVVGVDSGSVYVFDRAGTTWSFKYKVVPGAGSARYGNDVSVQGDLLAVGDPDYSPGGVHQVGQVHALQYNGSVWIHRQLTSPTGGDHAFFGDSVLLSGDSLFAGDPQSGGTNGGAVQWFARDGSNWSVMGTMENGAFGLGGALGIDGNTLIAGATWKSFIFVRDGTTWSEQATLDTVPVGISGHGSVDIDGDIAIVGTGGDDTVVGLAGSAFLYTRAGTVWSEATRVDDSAPMFGDQFGTAVALDGNYAVIGAPNKDGDDPDVGAAYLLTVTPSFAAFCNATDGALAACPCGNAGAPDSGCDLAQGTGGVSFEILTQQTTPQNRITATATGFPTMNSPSAVAIRATSLDAASPIPFGDGVRCVGTPLVRLGVAAAVGGTSTHVFGHGSMAGSGTRYYQLWFRNQPIMFCTPEAFNLSNGREIVW